MQVRYLRSTMSGLPGKRGLFILYRKPLRHKNFLTIISGFVFLLLMAAMLLWRCCEGQAISFKYREVHAAVASVFYKVRIV